MAKVVPYEMLDYYLNRISACSNMIAVCAGSPTSYTQCTGLIATGGCMIAMLPMTTGCFTLANGTPNGRTITVTAKTGASIVTSASALAVALVNTVSASVVFQTTCTDQYLVSGGTVDRNMSSQTAMFGQ